MDDLFWVEVAREEGQIAIGWWQHPVWRMSAVCVTEVAKQYGTSQLRHDGLIFFFNQRIRINNRKRFNKDLPKIAFVPLITQAMLRFLDQTLPFCLAWYHDPLGLIFGSFHFASFLYGRAHLNPTFFALTTILTQKNLIFLRALVPSRQNNRQILKTRSPYKFKW